MLLPFYPPSSSFRLLGVISLRNSWAYPTLGNQRSQSHKVAHYAGQLEASGSLEQDGPVLIVAMKKEEQTRGRSIITDFENDNVMWTKRASGFRRVVFQRSTWAVSPVSFPTAVCCSSGITALYAAQKSAVSQSTHQLSSSLKHPLSLLDISTNNSLYYIYPHQGGMG